MRCQCFVVLSFALLLTLCGQQSSAQDGTAGAPPSATLCNETDSMAFDPNQIAGIWYEVARNPAPTRGLLCAQLNLTALPDNSLNVSFTFARTPTYPWVNSTMSAQITLDSSTAGYNISYNMYGVAQPYTVYKLLATNYKDYAFLCGYTNATDSSTSFGIVMTRQQTVNTTVLASYEATASTSYADFLNGTMAQISQPATCAASGAMEAVRTVAAILLLAHVLLALWC